MMNKNKKIVILGAGFIGLRIGDILSREGIEVELIEAEQKSGGMVGTFSKEIDGDTYLFDYGPHLFFRDFKDIYQELVGSDLKYIEGTFSMMLEGKIFPYPLRILYVLKNLPPTITFKIVLEIVYNRMFRKREKIETVEDWFVLKFGKYLFETFYAPYISKSTGLPVHQTDVEWAAERVHVIGNSLYGTITQRIKTVLFKKSQQENLAGSDMMTAFYPIHGAGKITEAMANRIRKNGGTIHLSSPVRQVTIRNQKIDSVSFGPEGKITGGDHIISTLPLPSLIRYITPEVSPQLRIASDKLRFRHLLLMYLIINKAQVLEHIEVFFPDSDVIFKRIYEPKTLSTEMAPPHRTSLCLEICCDEGDQFSESDLFKRAIKNLESYNIIQEKDVLQYFTKRLPFSYPIYHCGFVEQRKLLLDYVGSVEDLTTIGRQGLFQYHAMTNECMAMAETIANEVLSGMNPASMT